MLLNLFALLGGAVADPSPSGGPLSDEERDEIQARWERITPGQWVQYNDAAFVYVLNSRGVNRIDLRISQGRNEANARTTDEEASSDAAFIAHAPEDVARLLAALDAAERRANGARNDALEEAVGLANDLTMKGFSGWMIAAQIRALRGPAPREATP